MKILFLFGLETINSMITTQYSGGYCLLSSLIFFCRVPKRRSTETFSSFSISRERERDGSLVHVRRDIRVLCFLASIDLLDPMRVRNTPTPSLPRHTLFARIALINHLLPAGTLCGRDTYWIPPGNNKHKTKEKERRKLFCNH